MLRVRRTLTSLLRSVRDRERNVLKHAPLTKELELERAKSRRAAGGGTG